ncbi:hypothetical protein HNR61_001853 [Actinomadura namibiensis]|uniref:Uncharacterized protein n=1 Tax=Actinomadura namibiensis TaxID=182080 RepID=A0A7W3LLB6_ACTNM|nr:hypothetical protein [Actinomadura namibiensis]
MDVLSSEQIRRLGDIGETLFEHLAPDVLDGSPGPVSER